MTYQLTASLTSTCSQTEVNDHPGSLEMTYSQQVEFLSKLNRCVWEFRIDSVQISMFKRGRKWHGAMGAKDRYRVNEQHFIVEDYLIIKIKLSVADSSQGSYTGQLDFCNRLADGSSLRRYIMLNIIIRQV